MSQPPTPSPRARGLLPWLLGAGALLAGFAMLLVLLLGDQGDEPSAVADLGATATVEPAAPATGSATPPATGSATPSLTGSATRSTPGDDAGGRFERSGETARRWVEAMAAGDFASAFALSCAEVQDSAVASAEDGDGAASLGDYFFQQVLGGDSFETVTLHEVRYDAVSGTDLVSFTLTADDGAERPLVLYVISDGTVCDFR
jgi:hypothetical protein